MVMNFPKNSSLRLISICLVLLLCACGGSTEKPAAEPASTTSGTERTIIYPAEFADGSPFSSITRSKPTAFQAVDV